MDETILALLAAGATTLVTAAATDAWTATRAGFVRLFGRGDKGREDAAADRLDELARRIEAVPADRRTDIRAREQPAWRDRLAELAEQDPDALADLRALVAELSAQVPAAPRVQVQNVIARDNGRAFGVQDGTIVYHEAPRETP